MEHKVLAPISILVFVTLLLLLPFVFARVMFTALEKLHLSPAAATALIFSMLIGGFLDMPVKRFVHEERVSTHPLAVFGLHDWLPRMRRARRETIVAVNVGGSSSRPELRFASCSTSLFREVEHGWQWPSLQP